MLLDARPVLGSAGGGVGGGLNEAFSPMASSPHTAGARACGEQEKGPERHWKPSGLESRELCSSWLPPLQDYGEMTGAFLTAEERMRKWHFTRPWPGVEITDCPAPWICSPRKQSS